MPKAIAVCTCETCGAEFTRVKYHQNQRDADSWRMWAEAKFDECGDCFKARLQQARKKTELSASRAAEASGLPKLSGTKQQVAWAVTIRQIYYRKLLEEEKALNKKTAWVQLPDGGKQSFTVRQFIAWIVNRHTNAAWWIDNRQAVKVDENTPKSTHLNRALRKWAIEFRDEMMTGRIT